ncbi:hypothetical protein JMN32_10175 [Fulvivirga sp. 29W222]|uniref:Chemotaxis methyl-accepting receptor HlyB-like 4HB MCP domain-containing protein n=1 Tax=Fulvivirga marina TaxID=2494733 RepID=A0A937FVE7_9BACT|nr:hypothetical protein [Fulvivirga marina]MBL6446679.1 hypothetical protein [Fulvivirga marina]
MKWMYQIAQKSKAAIALAIVFFIMLLTNIVDKSHFSALQKAFTTVYEDRLVVENYIYKLSVLFNQKKMLIEKNGDASTQHDNSIQQLIWKYGKTQLTSDEAIYFKKLQADIQQLNMLEQQYISMPEPHLISRIEQQHKNISTHLGVLSDIQLTETRRILKNSDQLIASSNFNSYLEISSIIVIGLIIQALIYTSKSIRPRFRQNSQLN